jgi:hypothetical protein
MCSKLLCEFATQNNEQLIISYAEVHNLTNPKIAYLEKMLLHFIKKTDVIRLFEI